MPVESIIAGDPMPPNLKDLAVMVPRARRYIEGPYGAPENRPALTDDQIYALIADALADLILVSGNLFGHKLIVTQRDATVGFPTKFETDVVLDEWEVSAVTTQTALNYFFFLFRDLKTSSTITNGNTEWSYSLSANVVRDYLKELQDRRDRAIQGLRALHPIIDRWVSNIRVRDQATVAILEWWDTNSAGAPAGLPGGQDASVIPWAPGQYGP